MMKKTSPQFYAVCIALLVSIVSGIIIIINFVMSGKIELTYLIVSVLSIFLLTYIPVFYILNNFIISRLRPIFDTINNIKLPTEYLYKNIENKDIIGEVNQEVINWAQNKTQEIVQLKANEKYRKEFLGNVSHELKTPLFNIQGYILTLIDGGMEDEKVNKKYLKQAAKNINRLISIVQDIETISRLESGEIKPQMDVFNLTALLKEILDMYEISSTKANIKLKLAFDFRKNIAVYADKKKIAQVVSNLVDNSIKYGKSGGATIIDVNTEGKKITVSVIDNGIGIPQQHQKRIFERFYRVDKSRSREQGGTGLGLAIVKHIIEAHGQVVKVTSEVEKGTTFSFTLEAYTKEEKNNIDD
jgi:two-component system phosphate regulon sensor histidine kinase PhoR